ncbi:hypothetical protein [Shimazuella kribbensis]|uniref:hypothetical protein n=1 Tax=Shimazuella kribbensis TaxID=139808 RepID=UPI00048AA975|nr:hypothetical protein [Shimazuella kribbensis]
MKVKVAGYTITNVARTEKDEAGIKYYAPENRYLLIRGRGIVGTASSVRIYNESEGMVHSYEWRMLRHKASGFALRSPGTKMTWHPSSEKIIMYLGKVPKFKINGVFADIGNIKNWVVLKKNGSWSYKQNRCSCHMAS